MGRQHYVMQLSNKSESQIQNAFMYNLCIDPRLLITFSSVVAIPYMIARIHKGNLTDKIPILRCIKEAIFIPPF